MGEPVIVERVRRGAPSDGVALTRSVPRLPAAGGRRSPDGHQATRCATAA